MNDAEIRKMNRESMALALNHILGDGQWHTLADLWARLQRDGNPQDRQLEAVNSLSTLIIRGVVEQNGAGQYRLVPFVG